jgi:hypothetical protein
VHTIDLAEDDGFIGFTFPGPDGPTVRVNLDIYRANNRFAQLHDEHPDPIALGDAWAAWLAEQGFPGLSHARAFAVSDAILARMASLKKSAATGSGNAEPSASTAAAPTTSDCPPAPCAS